MRQILVISTGLAPQVVTEMLWWLAAREDAPRVVPDSIYIVTTGRGAGVVREQLLGARGKLGEFCREFSLPDLDGRVDVRFPTEADVAPGDDTRNLGTNIGYANLITRLLRDLTSDLETRVHASLAGGRKTMSFYMGYAMSLLGREQDELSHVLVSPPALENSPDFWWKPTCPRMVRIGTNGDLCSTEDATIDVAPIPFARLRYLMSPALFADPAVDFRRFVVGAQAGVENQRVVLTDSRLEVRVGNHAVRLPPKKYTLYFFVVDRRVIVDEAHERARRLAEKMERAEDGILKTVADNLRQIARGGTNDFDEERPLAAHALRGGMYRSEAWARNPLQPAVVASTVDQIGSRLMFRAYGRGPGVWPIYAGLVANDSLILLDEAHCALPFLQTLQAVRRFRTWAHAPLGRSFCPVVMSATPPPGSTDVFTDRSDECLDPGHPLGRRRLARKPARLHSVKNAAGRRATTVFATALAEAASELIDEERRAIVVFANRVATARGAHRRLAAHHGDRAVLVTGRMRPADKDVVVQQRLKPLQSVQSTERSLAEPLIVVATQTLEVGADLDFDGLVTEPRRPAATLRSVESHGMTERGARSNSGTRRSGRHRHGQAGGEGEEEEDGEGEGEGRSCVRLGVGRDLGVARQVQERGRGRFRNRRPRPATAGR